MKEKNMRYGQFLRSKRIADSRELTLKDVAEELGVSVSFVSDVEQGRRKPYDEEKTEKLVREIIAVACGFFNTVNNYRVEYHRYTDSQDSQRKV